MSITTTWERVFAVDADGCSAEGFVEDDRKALVDAVKGGSPVRVALYQAEGHPVFDCPVVWARSDQVYAQSVRLTSASWANTTSCDHPERALRYTANPNHNQQIFSTNGERTYIVWNPRNHSWSAPQVTPMASEWFVPAAAAATSPQEMPGWECVYKHNGAVVQKGSVEALKEAIELGASVRFVIRQGSERTGRRRLHGYDAGVAWAFQVPGETEPQWLVTAIAEAQVGADYDAEKGHFEFPDPAQRWSILVDTNGRYETFIWHEPDGRTHQHGSRNRAVSWYVRR